MSRECTGGSTVSVIGRTMINENDAETYMKRYEYFDRDDMFPENIRTMEIKEWQDFARKNPYLAKFFNKKLPGYFLLALETWNSEVSYDICNPLTENIFSDVISHWRNMVLQDDEKSKIARSLLNSVGTALGSAPGD
jgi:hypothetical protein|tara:strand:- start:354 stop:764 length:411 start_codon:yes stop_codon:yes gene_type:complete